MSLTDAQLGRIARALRNHNRHTTQTVLIDAIDGRLDDAIETATYTAAPTHGLIEVLREVAAESAETERKRRECSISVLQNNGICHRRTLDGTTALDEARAMWCASTEPIYAVVRCHGDWNEWEWFASRQTTESTR